MGQVLHGCATTTEAVRRTIQNSQESLRALAKRYGINPKTVAKWKERETVADLPTGPKDAKSTVLSIEEEAIIVAFRRPCEARYTGRALGPCARSRLSVSGIVAKSWVRGEMDASRHGLRSRVPVFW